MSYAEYGLDEVKQPIDAGKPGNKYCPWCTKNVAVGFSLCFANFCICQSCLQGAYHRPLQWKADDGNGCMKCSKGKNKNTYEALFYDATGGVSICAHCIQWGLQVLTNQSNSTTMRAAATIVDTTGANVPNVAEVPQKAAKTKAKAPLIKEGFLDKNNFTGTPANKGLAALLNAAPGVTSSSLERVGVRSNEQLPSNINFQKVPLSAIQPDPNQPRKFFDAEALAELTESVRSKGVLQPILVRPVIASSGAPANGQLPTANPTYMLVCGERRFKASLAANLEEIPAVIRSLTDDEALELQIIENLQRKDVQPMEEAVSFKSLNTRFSVEELALRVGKSPQYVALRISLTNLIPDFQDMLFQHKMKLAQAHKLCRLLPESQQAILKERQPHSGNWRTVKDFELGNIDYFFDRELRDLSAATFKTKDPLLYPEMGACTTCKFNTANSPLLFPELNKKRCCSNAVCFNIKTDRAYQASIHSVVENPDVVLISLGSYHNAEEKKKIQAVEQLGVNVLNEKLFEVVEKPEPVVSWEAYLRGEDNWSDDDDYTPEERKQLEADCREEYDTEVKNYNADLERYEANIASGQTKKAFAVIGDWRAKTGTYVDIVLKSAKNGIAQSIELATGEASPVNAEVEIIMSRESRNKELDAEKVDAEVVTIFRNSTNYIDPKRDWRLTQNEIIASALVLFQEGSYTYREWAMQKYKLSEKYTLKPADLKAFETLTEFALNEMLRHFIKDKLDHQAASRFTNAKAAAVHALAMENEEQLVLQAMDTQEAIAIARAERVQKRIAALQRQSAKVSSGVTQVPIVTETAAQ